MRIEFSMPMMNYGIITVENAIDGGFAQPLEYKIDVSDFDVTIEGLRAASLLHVPKIYTCKTIVLWCVLPVIWSLILANRSSSVEVLQGCTATR